MNADIKQAMHVGAAKSFGSAEANENERRWSDEKIDYKNQDPTNHYDKSRMRLNFEIDKDGNIKPLGYHEKSLEIRLNERLNELGWHPFKADSKIQPNCCAKIIFGGNHERTLEMAFGSQEINFDKDSDNSSLKRCQEIENWAKDVHAWCVKNFGQENVIGFQVHLDESSPHIHALIVPVGTRGKSGKEHVMWSAKFGKNPYEYGKILRDMHTSLYEEVGSKYGLERGDSVHGRNVQHMHKRDYVRSVIQEAKKAEKTVKSLQTMIKNLQNQAFHYTMDLKKLEKALNSGKLELSEYNKKTAEIKSQLADCQDKLNDKSAMLTEKQEELEKLTKDVERVSALSQPFKNHAIDFTPPRITEKPPMFGVDKWLDVQNNKLEFVFNAAIRKLESIFRKDAQQQVEAYKQNAMADYKELWSLREENQRLSETNQILKDEMINVLDRLVDPETRNKIFTMADSLIGGKPVITSGGGGGSDSDFRWDGRRPDEEENIYRRRCLITSIKFTHPKSARFYKR